MKPPTPKDPWPDPPGKPVLSDEQLGLHRWRYRQARRAGLTIAESQLFAGSDADVGVLRNLAARGATPEQIARIVI